MSVQPKNKRDSLLPAFNTLDSYYWWNYLCDNKMKKDWEIKKLGDVCEIYQPRTISISELKSDGKFLVFGANGIIGRYDRFNHEDAEILLTCRGATCGTINISMPFSWITGNAMVVKPKADNLFIKRFLYFLLKSIDYSKIIRGAAQPQITRQSLSPTLIPIPPLPVQEKIVAELDTLHRLKELQEQQLTELDNLAQSTFYDMFGDPIDNEKGWEVKKLGEVCEIISGSTPKTNVTEYWENGNQKWITPAEIRGDTIIIKDTARHITHKAVKETNLKLLPKNTVLLSTRAPIGKVAIAGVEMYCNQGFKNFVCSNSIIPIFLYFTLKYNTNYLNSLGRGATFKEVSSRIVSNIKIGVPLLHLQTQFAERIEKIESQKELIKQSIAQTQHLIDYTMDKYFG